MRKPAYKIEYDKESQVLSWQTKKAKSVDSDIHGNVVIDYDKNGDIVRINFYKFNFEDFKGHRKDIQHFASKRSIVEVR